MILLGQGGESLRQLQDKEHSETGTLEHSASVRYTLTTSLQHGPMVKILGAADSGLTDFVRDCSLLQ